MPKQCSLPAPSLLQNADKLMPAQWGEVGLQLALTAPLDDHCTTLKSGLLQWQKKETEPLLEFANDNAWVWPTVAAAAAGVVFLTGTEQPRKLGLPIAQTLKFGPVQTRLNVVAGPYFHLMRWDTTTTLRLSNDQLTLRYAGRPSEPVLQLGLAYSHGNDFKISALYDKGNIGAEMSWRIDPNLRLSAGYSHGAGQLSVSGTF